MRKVGEHRNSMSASLPSSLESNPGTKPAHLEEEKSQQISDIQDLIDINFDDFDEDYQEAQAIPR